MQQRPADPAPQRRAIAAIAALEEPLRARMYGFIRAADRPVTRDAAAAHVGISRKLAAFHLDKLVGAGLLQAHYERPAGPPSLGRTPKVYEPAPGNFRVSIPERQFDVLADILLDAVLAERLGEPARDAALRVAARRGRSLGALERAGSARGHVDAQLAVAEKTLRTCGYEPARGEGPCLRLRNCPFHPLAAKAPQLVCGINHAFLAGFLAGARFPRMQAVLEPRAGECCVEIRSLACD